MKRKWTLPLKKWAFDPGNYFLLITSWATNYTLMIMYSLLPSSIIKLSGYCAVFAIPVAACLALFLVNPSSTKGWYMVMLIYGNANIQRRKLLMICGKKLRPQWCISCVTSERLMHSLQLHSQLQSIASRSKQCAPRKRNYCLDQQKSTYQLWTWF